MVPRLLLAWTAVSALMVRQAAPRPVPPAPLVLYTPTSAIGPALADLETLPDAIRSQVRYLSAYNVADVNDLSAWRQTLAFVVNSLSRNNVCVSPTAVPGGHGRLWRVLLTDYKIDPKAWDRLGQRGSGRVPFPEPYFHLYGTFQKPIVKTWEYGYYDTYGRWVRTKTETTTELKTVVALANPPWLPKLPYLQLQNGTESQFPIMRTDWFCYYATLEPRYHELLGLGDTKADFLKLAVADEKTADREGVQLRGAVLFSEVAPNNRHLERTPTILRYGRGYYWESLDYGTSVQQDLRRGQDQDVLRNLLNRKPDAQELIATLRNGLQAYLVVDGKGNRLDRAGIEFARDYRNKFNSAEVEIRNCMCCHAQGMIRIDDEVRKATRNKLALNLGKLQKKHPRQAQRILDRYFAADINELVRADQQAFTAALQSCNGLAPAANATQLRSLLREYEAPLNLRTASRETGYPEPVVLGVIERSRKTGLDHSATRLGDGGKSRREQWESRGFGQLLSLLAAVPPEEGK